MKILLDTHVLIWFAEGIDRISAKAKSHINNPDSQKFASIASVWEVVIKSSKDKLDFKKSTNEIMEFLEINQIQLLNIELKYLDTLQILPHHHGDPFDRMIICQAITEGLTIISADHQFSAYDVNVSW